MMQLSKRQQAAVERWQIIKGFSCYMISDLGKVKKIRQTCVHDTHPIGMILKPRIRKGYYAVSIESDAGKSIDQPVHRLVLKNFVGNPPDGYVAHHRNADVFDNKLQNLAWVTISENVKQAFRAGNLNQSGQNNNGSKLNKKQVVLIKKLLQNTKLKHHEIAKLFNVARVTVTQINCNINWGEITI